jgi:GR25 family glycosyltransferase involved in LPS biosynthesis
MKTFVINLDKYINNFIYQKPILENIGLKVERFRAINALENEHLNYKKYINNISLDFCPTSIIGCSLSHILLSELIDKEQYEITLIMEDDAFPIYDKKNFNKLLKKTISEISILDKDWDIIQLHSDAPFPTYETYFTHFLSGSTAAYLISKKGAEKMKNMKATWHIDIQTSANSKFKKYRSHYNLFWTKENTSVNRSEKNLFLTNLYGNILTQIIPLRGEKTWNDFLKFKILKIRGKDIYAYEIINNCLLMYICKFCYDNFNYNIKKA